MSRVESRLLRDKRGISPVVATVILVAVTIVVAVAVAYWMGGIASLYTRFEKVEITSAYAVYGDTAFGGTDPGWTVTLNLKNSGSADATIEFALINGKPLSEYSGVATVTTTLPLTITTGETQPIELELKKDGSFTAGTTIELKLHSASGQDYPKTITLD